MDRKIIVKEQEQLAMYKISPSILSADFSELGRDVMSAAAGGADYIHIDVMDGKFVPNISIGFPVIASLRKITAVPFDVHIMIDRPDLYAERFVKAGADILTFHLEATNEYGAEDTLKMIRALGARAGLSIKPATPVETIRKYLPLCDLVLLMTVEPGFGGQSFIPSSIKKIIDTRRLIDSVNPSCELEVDGGIDEHNIADLLAAGANVFVMGSAIFSAGTVPADRIRQIRQYVK